MPPARASVLPDLPRFAPPLLLLGVHVLSLLAARSLAEAAVPVLVLFAGVSVFSCLRGGVLSRESAAALVPVLAAAALAFGLIGNVQRIAGHEAVSTEGNRNYSGALAAMLLPVMVAFTRAGKGSGRILSGLAAANLGVLLLLSESRGSLIAAGAGLVLAAAAMGAKRVNRGAVAVGIALLLLVSCFGAFQLKQQISPERLETAGFRKDVWKSGLRMVAARPLLGWGAGNFAVEYPPFRSEAEFRYSHKYVTENFKELEDAHSSWVQIAVDTGVAGILALLLVVYVAARLWRYYVKVAPDGDRAAILAGLGGGAAAYLIAGLFNTLTLKTSHTVLFWSFLGLIELIGDVRPWRASGRSREARVAIPAAAAFVAFFGAFWAGRMGVADAAYIAGMSSDHSGREARLRESLESNPYAWQAHCNLSLELYALGRFQGAAEEGRATLRLRPFHLESLNHTAISLIRAEGDPREIESLFRRALEVAPYYGKTYHNFATFERQRGNRAEARRLFGLAIEHNPHPGASYFWRGLLSYSEGDVPMAIEDFRKSKSHGFDVEGALKSQRLSAENDARLAEFFR